MAVTYSNALKSTRMNAVITALGSGAKLVIGTSALSGATGVLCTVPLANPAGTITGAGTDVLTFTMPQSDNNAAATGTAAKAELRTSADVVVISGLTVSAAGGGGDIQLATTAINAGNVVTINAATITHG